MGQNIARFLGLKFTPLQTNVDSPDGSGEKVIMSKTFKDAGVPENCDLFLDCFKLVAKKPPEAWMLGWSSVLKYKEVEESETDDGSKMKVKYVLDGKKLNRQPVEGINVILDPMVFPPEWDGQDVIVQDREYTFHKEDRTIVAHDYKFPRFDGSERNFVSKTVTKVVDPLAVAIYFETADGTRLAGDLMGLAVAPFLEAVGRVMCRKVRLAINDENAKIYSLDPMDPYITYERFIEVYTQGIKDGPKLFGDIVASDATEDGVTVITYNKADGTESGFIVLTVNEDTGHIVAETNFADHFLAKQIRTHIQVNKEPLGYEIWNEDLEGTSTQLLPDDTFVYEQEKLDVLLTSGWLTWLLS